jgi:hypothetical protein
VRTAQARLDHLAGCGWFWTWALVGCGAALGAVSFAIGTVLWLPTLVVTIVMASSTRIRRSAFGLLTGGGAVCLFIAWVQRRGPSEGYLDPRPWLAIGVVLAVAGLVGHTVRSRRTG